MSRLVFWAYVLAAAMVTCLLVEWESLELNTRAGTPEPFFLNHEREGGVGVLGREYSVLDPHLGYGHGSSESRVRDLVERGHQWRDGFAVYAKPEARTAHPIVLALGGSTTDPVQYGHSWPEELARLLETERIPATVINGGVGGYSTSQELLKLIRDGLELEPDIVISYSGVNDRGTYGRLPHPFVHTYQRDLLREWVERPAPWMPNTLLLIRRSTGLLQRGAGAYTLGVPTQRSYVEWYVRNLQLMTAICRASDAEFFGVLQPNAYVGDSALGAEFEGQEGKPAEYVAALRAFYSELRSNPELMAQVYDLTDIFDEHREAYVRDGVHTTVAGEVILARKIYDVIAPTLRSLEDGARR